MGKAALQTAAPIHLTLAAQARRVFAMWLDLAMWLGFPGTALPRNRVEEGQRFLGWRVLRRDLYARHVTG
jgi:hypothetical protein